MKGKIDTIKRSRKQQTFNNQFKVVNEFNPLITLQMLHVASDSFPTNEEINNY